MFIPHALSLIIVCEETDVFKSIKDTKYTVSIYPALFKRLYALGFLVFNHILLINPIMSHLNHSTCGAAN